MRSVVSLAISAVLALQAMASLDLFPRLAARPSWLFWPFLDYPMYARAHHEGERIGMHVVVGTRGDGTEVVVAPGDLGLDFWRFERHVVGALRAADRGQARFYAEIYRRRTGRRLTALRLEDHGLVVTRAGGRGAAPEVLGGVRLEPGRP